MDSRCQYTMEQNNILFERDKKKISKLISEGNSLMDISKQENISYHSVQKRILKSIKNIDTTKVELGYKDAPYYDTEEEMLIDKEYNYNNLSEDEKEIYNQREEASSIVRYFTNNDGLYGGCEG